MTANMRLALTHRSMGRENNERLEFLGDSILNLVIAEWLYQQHPDKPEGYLAQARASMVCTDRLYRAAIDTGLDKLVQMSSAARNNRGGCRNIYADAVEAVIAAVYLDSGLEGVRGYITGYLRLTS